MAPFRLRIDGATFRDPQNRAVTLRGINIDASAKYPKTPDIPSHVPDDFYDGDNVSFVGRPFALNEAGVHFSRLKNWGYNQIRYIFTWEAIEHAGPGRYDEDWITFTIEILKIAKSFGFFVYMDPHQDVWSRLSGGSGAPMWTLYAAGFDPRSFNATQAAFVHNTYPNPATFPKMLWSTNYTRLFCQTIFTLFWAGRDFAPKAIIDGKNIQDYLQDHFIAAIKHLATRIHQAGDLEDEVVIGWESMNEPNRGLIGIQDISVIPPEQQLQLGTSPTAFQGMLLGSGNACEVTTWEFGGFGPRQTGRELVDPEGDLAWLPASYDDTAYGWERDPQWKLGECIWAQHGVWDPATLSLRQSDYFAKVPSTGEKLSYEGFTNKYFMAHYRKYRDSIRSIHKNAILFCQPPVMELPPSIKGTSDDDPNMVHAIHFYDGLTLMTKHWSRVYNIDVVGLLRGRYWSPAFAVKLGESAIRNCLRDQIRALRKEGIDYMGNHPAVITEIGIPYDMDDKKAYETGDYSSQRSAMDANHFGIEGSGVNGYSLWTYAAQNSHQWGDNWNGEDLSVLSPDDLELPSSTLIDRLSPSFSQSRANVDNKLVEPSNIKSTLSIPSISSESRLGTAVAGQQGYRAAEAYVRPGPVAINGNVSKYGFDLRNCVFTLSLTAQSSTSKNAPSVIYLPEFHFPKTSTDVTASGGIWEITTEPLEFGRVQRLSWWHAEGDQRITIRGVKRKGGADNMDAADQDGYLDQCRQSPCTILEQYFDGKDMADSVPHSLIPLQETSANEGPNSQLVGIIQALDAIHSRTSTNEVRKQASELLEQQKHNKDAAQTGYFLAANKTHTPLVRHFGLSLLEHTLKYNSADLNQSQIGHLKDLVISLSEGIQQEDPPYIRNKVPLLWVEFAKRFWGPAWIGMDEALVRLWTGSMVHREFVLSVVETLSEDIIHQEDTASSLRGTDLNRALVEICTPFSVYKEIYPNRDHHVELRCGEEGWLMRVTEFLNDCIQNIQSTEAKVCAVKALGCLRSLIAWAIPLAISTSQTIPVICQTLALDDERILLAAVEALHALYGRTSYGIEEFQGLVNIVYQNHHLALLKKLYERSIVTADNISETKYSISKKLSELMSYLAGFLEEKNVDFSKHLDIPNFLSFMITILQHTSLTVSIPVLHSWTRLLVCEQIGHLDVINSLIGQLLEVCTQRLVRYEAIPEDSDDPTIIFLNDDIDTIPEKHAFVSNYRRYCSHVIEIIVQKHAGEAIPHILQRTDFALNNLYTGCSPFNPSTYQKQTMPVLRADTQFAVVEAMLKGYTKWCQSLGSAPQQDEQLRVNLETTLESWATGLMERNFEDPTVKQRVIRLCVDVSAKVLESKPSYALKVLEHILGIQVAHHPEFAVYSDAAKELYSMATYEVRRLAVRYSDYFATFYEPLEAKIQEINLRSTAGDRPQMDLSAILLIIMQRARNVEPYLRQSRLRAFLEPIRQAWADESMKQILHSFQGFYEVLGLSKVHPYLQKRQAQKVEDWSTIQLDPEGKSLQEELNQKFSQLPLRATRTMLAVSTDKVKKGEPAYEIACELWKDTIPLILPTLLQLLSHAHAFHNPDNWTGLSTEMRPFDTLEGFSSSVRGKVRAVREACYSVLYSMTKLEEYFYGLDDLPAPLTQALYENATHLSSHQFSVLLNISRCLIDDCPTRFRRKFLPQIMSTLFVQLDRKITSEWDIIQRRKVGIVDDNLTEEMKDESILRQLTYSAVIMVASLLDPQREGSTMPNETGGQGAALQQSPDSMRNFILSSTQILEPVLLFCTHALQMHDTRCCSIITRVIRSILREFVPTPDTPTAATIREFISSEILKACITSVHDPYFVDMQKELALLISTVWILYGPITRTPRTILLSLPGMTESKVTATEDALLRSTSGRQQKAIILDLLEGVRGVRISEQGRILAAPANRRKDRSTLQERYMAVEMEGQEEGRVDINNGPDLTGVADMFS
ncbi:hypothetical protein FQN57_004461 [Myotisia sp. PD_48]|nr:hypothetical protein FQN57_004461 [Myotisia sp. PD_48]